MKPVCTVVKLVMARKPRSKYDAQHAQPSTTHARNARLKTNFASVCKGSQCTKHAGMRGITDTSDSTAFSELCTIQAHKPRGSNYSVSVDHHVHDNLTDMWLKGSSMPQPTITLSASINKADYDLIGFPHNTPNRSVKVDCIADTGCQSCLGGPLILNQLGFTEKDLIPMTMSMRAANNNKNQDSRRHHHLTFRT